MALFGNTNKPRQFNYQPIYHDPRKASLKKRTDDIRDELIGKGELEPTSEDIERRNKQNIDGDTEDAVRSKIHRSLRHTMSHLPAQEKKGKAGANRKDEFFRIVVMLILIALVVWYLYFRK